MGSMRPHGVFEDYEPQITGLVEGISVESDAVDSTVIFVVPTYSPDWRYGPAPYVGGSDPGGLTILPGELIPRGVRLLVAFTNEGRPWVLGWTTQA